MSSKDYGWVIDRDHLEEGNIEIGNLNGVGTIGPKGVDPTIIARLTLGEGTPFRLLDDDDKLYYEGRIIIINTDHPEVEFAPLDDYGAPGAGCTSIAYQNAQGVWETL